MCFGLCKHIFTQYVVTISSFFHHFVVSFTKTNMVRGTQICRFNMFEISLIGLCVSGCRHRSSSPDQAVFPLHWPHPHISQVIHVLPMLSQLSGLLSGYSLNRTDVGRFYVRLTHLGIWDQKPKENNSKPHTSCLSSMCFSQVMLIKLHAVVWLLLVPWFW